MERIEQQKQDEEFARQLQSKENSDAVSNGSPSFSTRKRTNSSVTPSPSRSKVNKKLILSKQTKGQTRQMTIEEMVKQGQKRKRDDIYKCKLVILYIFFIHYHIILRYALPYIF